MSEQKKQSFLHGTALLAMATAAVKVIGALYKIPLNAIIGEQGFAYFNTAYEIYNVLLMIATAGLPVAMSRMISDANSLGHYNQVRRTYKTASVLFLSLGILGSLLMTLLCRELAEFQQQPDAWAAIACLGPCVLLICIMSTFRGYFQGQGNMLPTSVSQVLEAVSKLIVGMFAAVVLLKTTRSIPYAAAGAILGVTFGCVISVFYLFSRFRRSFVQLPASDDAALPYGRTAKELLAIAIPITIGSAGISVLTMLETKIYMSQLLYQGFAQGEADTMKGIYDFCKTIFNMPCAFITPITISILPAITAQLSLREHAQARDTAESAIRVLGLISMPCAVGIAVLANPVTALLGGYTGEKLELATQLMAVLGICIVFNALVQLTNAIMQSHGHVNPPVINMFIGGALKLLAVYILTRNPHLGILGGPIGSLLCYATIAVLNIVTMRRCIEHPPAVLKNLLRPLLAALIMGVFVWLSWYGLQLVTTSRIVLCALPVMVGVAVYFFIAIKCKVITRADCLLLPKGEKIANFLRL